VSHSGGSNKRVELPEVEHEGGVATLGKDVGGERGDDLAFGEGLPTVKWGSGSNVENGAPPKLIEAVEQFGWCWEGNGVSQTP
jgi:hypothetical protein